MIRIAELDVYDDEAVRRWQHAEQTSIDHDSPHAVPRPYDALVAYLREPNPRSRRILLAATTEHDQVVGAAEVALPLADNTHLVHLSIQVDPGHRREGIGSSLLAAIDDAAWSADRTTTLGEVSSPVAEPSAGLLFADARGFDTVHEEDHLVLELPLADDRLAAVGERASGSARDYEVLTWGNRCPDELAEAYCAMRTTMNQDVPTGAGVTAACAATPWSSFRATPGRRCRTTRW